MVEIAGIILCRVGVSDDRLRGPATLPTKYKVEAVVELTEGTDTDITKKKGSLIGLIDGLLARLGFQVSPVRRSKVISVA